MLTDIFFGPPNWRALTFSSNSSTKSTPTRCYVGCRRSLLIFSEIAIFRTACLDISSGFSGASLLNIATCLEIAVVSGPLYPHIYEICHQRAVERYDLCSVSQPSYKTWARRCSSQSVWMTDLGTILGRLGLDQYHDALVEEGFDTWETVLDIQESDL